MVIYFNMVFKYILIAQEYTIAVCRYLSNDSNNMSTYGFVDISFNSELSSVKHESGSFYFFIPQVSLFAFFMSFIQI